MTDTPYAFFEPEDEPTPPEARRSVYVPFGDRSYEVLIGSGLNQAIAEFAQARTERVVVVSSPKVAQFHLKPLQAALQNAQLRHDVVLFPDGEEFKVLRTVGVICERMSELGCDRHTLLINLGGGVVSDVANFVAATYMRGIASVNVPTTLLGQVDAAIGGKCGVNLESGKNLVGAVHQPTAVFCDMEHLKTLAYDEFRNGMAEVVKYGVIWDPDLFEHLERCHERILARDPNLVERIVHRCAQVKADVVSQDEREQGVRKILNFGHTVGHAIESATGYGRFKHGFAVSIGMVAESVLAQHMELVPRDVVKRLEALLDKLDLPRAADDVDIDRILLAMRQDKKKKDDALNFVLPLNIGEVAEVEDVPPHHIVKALESVIVNFDW